MIYNSPAIMNIRTFVTKSRTFVAKSATWFSKNEGGGSTAVWKFSENSSVLVGTSFPKDEPLEIRQAVTFWDLIWHISLLGKGFRKQKFWVSGCPPATSNQKYLPLVRKLKPFSFYRVGGCSLQTIYFSFLSDPGIPGVRSMGPSVCQWRDLLQT